MLTENDDSSGPRRPRKSRKPRIARAVGLAAVVTLAAFVVTVTPAVAGASASGASPAADANATNVEQVSGDGHSLVVVGAGTRTQYRFATTDTLTPNSSTIESWDAVDDASANGWVTSTNQTDRFRFTGALSSFAFPTGDASVRVDGETVDPTPDWNENVTAVPVAAGQRVSTSDARWFAVHANEGDALAATASFGAGEWRIYGPNGTQLTAFESDEAGDPAAFGAVAPATGTYYVRAPTTASTDFVVERAAPDKYEANDARDDAASIQGDAPVSAVAAEGDDDWYAVDLTEGRTANVTVDIDDEDAVIGRQVAVSVVDADGNPVGETAETGFVVVDRNPGRATVQVTPDRSGTYYVHVRGTDQLDGFLAYRLSVTGTAAGEETATQPATTGGEKESATATETQTQTSTAAPTASATPTTETTATPTPKPTATYTQTPTPRQMTHAATEAPNRASDESAAEPTASADSTASVDPTTATGAAAATTTDATSGGTFDSIGDFLANLPDLDDLLSEWW